MLRRRKTPDRRRSACTGRQPTSPAPPTGNPPSRRRGWQAPARSVRPGVNAAANTGPAPPAIARQGCPTPESWSPQWRERNSVFTWNILLTSIMALLAFPVLTAALLVLEVDRKLGAQVFSAHSGGAILWQHLFWFFGHPEGYIVALPFFGLATEILPVFSRKPCFGYQG